MENKMSYLKKNIYMSSKLINNPMYSGMAPFKLLLYKNLFINYYVFI